MSKWRCRNGAVEKPLVVIVNRFISATTNQKRKWKKNLKNKLEWNEYRNNGECQRKKSIKTTYLARLFQFSFHFYRLSTDTLHAFEIILQ